MRLKRNIHQFYRFLIQWILSRPYSALIPAIPAILAAGLVSGLALNRGAKPDLELTYVGHLNGAATAGDLETAKIASCRLTSFAPNNPQYQFRSAVLEWETEHSERSVRAIIQLAIERNYGPAALFLMRQIVDGIGRDASKPPVAVGDEQRDELCHRCASIAIAELPDSEILGAKRLYASYLAERGFRADALRLYQSICDDDPSVAATVARLASDLGRPNDTKRYAELALAHLQPRLVAAPSSATLRIDVAQTLVLLNRFHEAYQLLIDGMEITPDQRLQRAAGESLVFQSVRLSSQPLDEANFGQRAELLSRAFQLAPKSPLVVEAITQLAIQSTSLDESVRGGIEQRLLEGTTPHAMHFVQGTLLLEAGKASAAAKHFEIAARTSPAPMPGLLNNLAVALSDSGPENLEQALRYSNEALRQLPDHPFLLETRGQILLKLGRNRDAISDLERVLTEPRLQPAAHRGLSVAYTRLGLTDIADRHKSLAVPPTIGLN